MFRESVIIQQNQSNTIKFPRQKRDEIAASVFETHILYSKMKNISC